MTAAWQNDGGLAATRKTLIYSGFSRRRDVPPFFRDNKSDSDDAAGLR